MKRNKIVTGLAILLLLAVGGYGAYWIGMDRGMKMASPAPSAATQAAEGKSEGKKVLYWHDPMVPAQKFDKPGKSPFMDMMLVPVYAGDAGDEGSVAISSRVEQNLGIRTAEVTKGPLAAAIEVIGSVAYNERELAVVQARANGFLERLYARAPLDRVAKGSPLAELLVPDWVAAQEEFLAVSRMSDAGIGGLRDGARQRMRLAGMSDEQIKLVESTGKVHPRMTLVAPISGVISELSAREGMTVMAGAALFRINGIGTVWVNAEIPESLAAMVKPGLSTLDIDLAAEAFIRSKGGRPAFKGYYGFTGTLCTSVNDEVVHGIPKAASVLKDGDIISIDLGVGFEGYFTDAAQTHPVREVTRALESEKEERDQIHTLQLVQLDRTTSVTAK